MVWGPLMLGIGIGLIAGQLLAGALIGLGAGITIQSVIGALHPKEARRREVA
jgi:hypothetical protein